MHFCSQSNVLKSRLVVWFYLPAMLYTCPNWQAHVTLTVSHAFSVRLVFCSLHDLKNGHTKCYGCMIKVRNNQMGEPKRDEYYHKMLHRLKTVTLGGGGGGGLLSICTRNIQHITFERGGERGKLLQNGRGREAQRERSRMIKWR